MGEYKLSKKAWLWNRNKGVNGTYVDVKEIIEMRKGDGKNRSGDIFCCPCKKVRVGAKDFSNFRANGGTTRDHLARFQLKFGEKYNICEKEKYAKCINETWRYTRVVNDFIEFFQTSEGKSEFGIENIINLRGGIEINSPDIIIHHSLESGFKLGATNIIIVDKNRKRYIQQHFPLVTIDISQWKNERDITENFEENALRLFRESILKYRNVTIKEFETNKLREEELKEKIKIHKYTMETLKQKNLPKLWINKDDQDILDIEGYKISYEIFFDSYIENLNFKSKYEVKCICGCNLDFNYEINGGLKGYIKCKNTEKIIPINELESLLKTYRIEEKKQNLRNGNLTALGIYKGPDSLDTNDNGNTIGVGEWFAKQNWSDAEDSHSSRVIEENANFCETIIKATERYLSDKILSPNEIDEVLEYGLISDIKESINPTRDEPDAISQKEKFIRRIGKLKIGGFWRVLT
jgi:hypothetical protein